MAPRSSTVPALDFRALFESAPGLNLVIGRDFVITAVSDSYLAATRTRREDIVGRNLFDVFPDNPEDPQATGAENLRASLERVLETRRPDAMGVQKYDIRRPDAEGGGFEERYWSPLNSPVLDERGQVDCIIHSVQDVTEFVRRQRMRNVDRRLASDPGMRAGLMEIEIFLRAQDLQATNRELRELKDDLERRVQARTAELEATNAELEREVSEHKVTEDALRKSEEQLRQAQKLEAIGRLAGGIAHDFNNVLTAIFGHCQLARMRAPTNAELNGEILEVEKGAERAAALTRQLLAFSRQQVLRPIVLDLNTIITDMDRMLRRMIGEDVILVTRTAPDLGHVRADRGQIEQVVMNLVVNARDAMPAGGELTIETANVVLEESPDLASDDIEPGRYVELAVSDTGTGMTPEVRARLFEPFFTTKEVGRGTGLGLSTVHGIVKQSDGHVEVETEERQGSTFRIFLPRVEAPLEVAEAPQRVPEPSRHRGGETILLVEDDDIVRNVVTKTLALHGYRVLEATERTRAMEWCENERKAGNPIDLMVSDVVMPGPSIPDLMRVVARSQPGMRILYISGHADRALLHEGVTGRDSPFLGKPFTSDALLAKVREVLASPRRP